MRRLCRVCVGGPFHLFACPVAHGLGSNRSAHAGSTDERSSFAVPWHEMLAAIRTFDATSYRDNTTRSDWATATQPAESNRDCQTAIDGGRPFRIARNFFAIISTAAIVTIGAILPAAVFSCQHSGKTLDRTRIPTTSELWHWKITGADFVSPSGLFPQRADK